MKSSGERKNRNLMKRKANSSTKKKTINRFSGLALLLITLAAFTAAAILFSNRTASVEAALQKGTSENGIPNSAAQQIQALLDEKEARTATERKIDSQLLYSLKQSRGQAIANGVQTLETRVDIDKRGMTTIDIVANDLKGARIKFEQMGIDVISAVGNGIRARVNIDKIDSIAALPEVRFVSPQQDAKTQGRPSLTNGRAPLLSPSLLSSLSPGFPARAARVRKELIKALPLIQKARPNAINALNVSEGDKTHKADTARASFGFNGTGVKVGVLSDGVSSLAAIQASGDLGPVTVLAGQAGSGDEGTAMLEIVHDLAPGAQLFFATAFNGITSFAQNIRDLRTAGCDIIVDDVIYFVETPMQDGQAPAVVSNTNGGVVIQAVNDVTAGGAMYFSSAGNEGNVNDGTGSVWEGDFVDGGANALIPGGTVHNFGGGNLNNQITTAGARVLLFWSDPLGGSANDYDIFVLNSTATAVLASSTNIQTGTQDPQEDAGNQASGRRLVIFRKTGGAARFLHLNCFGAGMALTTPGNTHGHNSALNAFGCAATPAAATPFGGPPGPFPNPFNSTNKVETFSSDGPRRILFNANSTPITPGNVSSTGGILRQKPDITAADGVSCAAPGFSTFFGTSAAAPHAAAIAALVKSAAPAATPAQIRTALITSAIDIEAAGTDRDSGAGIVMAFEALQAIGAAPTALIVSAGATLVSESCAPANGVLDPNETVTVSLCVQNTGGANTSNLVGTLQATGGVTSPSGPQNYGVVVAGGPPVCRNFTFTVNGTCGGTITATLDLEDTGGGARPAGASLGSVTYTFTLGTPVTAFTQNFDGVTAPNLPAGWAATQGVNAGGFPLWVTSSSGTPAPPADTAPNAIFSPDPANLLDNRIDTPSIAITSANAQLSFRNNFNLESTFDGGVLEIAIGAGAFTDIIAAGGTFGTNGYNSVIDTDFASPIAGRNAWSGNSGGFVTTTVTLPAAAAGQSIKLRFRMGSDNSVSAVGWRVDTVTITDGALCCTGGGGGGPCAESFDTVTPPAFPTGWTATTAIDCVNSNPWETSNAGTPAPPADTAPNAAFVNDPNCISDERLDSPVFNVTSATSTVTFRRNNNLENGFDGAVLEISVNGGAFQDIIAAGGSFAVGGYNGVISVNFGSPIAGRNAWTGNSAGFVTTTVNLPAAANGGTVVLRWRRGSDSSVSGQGIRIDTLTSTGTSCGANCNSITCPANITQSNDANQCGAVVNYPPPTTSGQCAAPTCSPASGSFFPVGTTTVTCTTTGPPQRQCSFTVTVVDTQPPTITCPGPQTAVAPASCPIATSAIGTFPAPTASDNCPGVTVACVPPSGSPFPVGTTTVTCTATDAAGNTATCSFAVTSFNVCLQDDNNPGNRLLINTQTGQYRFFCANTATPFTGVGKMGGNRPGSCLFSLRHTTVGVRVEADFSTNTKTGSASIQSPPGTERCGIQDRNLADNNCNGGGGPPASANK